MEFIVWRLYLNRPINGNKNIISEQMRGYKELIANILRIHVLIDM